MPKFASIYRSRGYRHLDNRVSAKKAESIAITPGRVARHAFYPLIRREIAAWKYSKKTGRTSKKTRVIYYASHTDSAIYSWYAAILGEKYEQKLSPSTFSDAPLAYRKFRDKRCNIHFAKDAFAFIKKSAPCAVFCFDIEGFFDNLSHDLLLKEWKEIMDAERLPQDHWAVYKNLTSYCWFEESIICERHGTLARKKPLLCEKYGPLSKRKPKLPKKKMAPPPPLFSLFTDTKPYSGSRFCSPEELRQLRKDGHLEKHTKTHGIPQGNPMSSVLSNIYMMPFDREMSNYVNALGGFYRRYSDDIIIIAPERHEYGVKFAVERAVKARELKIQTQKTEFAIFTKLGKCSKQHIQYLGFTYDGLSTRLRCQTLGKANNRVHRHLFDSNRSACKNVLFPNLYTRKFHIRFSSRGKRNFIAYGKRCVEIIGCPAIEKQLKRHKNRNLILLRKRKKLRELENNDELISK